MLTGSSLEFHAQKEISFLLKLPFCQKDETQAASTEIKKINKNARLQ